jgi:hypothetical protein
MKGKALGRLQEPDTKMGPYYPPDDALKQFLQALKLCVDAVGSMPRRTRVGPQYGGATTHSSVLYIVAD